MEVGINNELNFFLSNYLQQLFIICFELDEHFPQNRNNTINIHGNIILCSVRNIIKKLCLFPLRFIEAGTFRLSPQLYSPCLFVKIRGTENKTLFRTIRAL